MRQHGLTLSAVARHLDLSINSIPRALVRAEDMLSTGDLNREDLILF